MSDNNTSLIKKGPLMKPVGLAAKVAQAQANKKDEPKVDCSTFTNRIGIIIDDSGSMGEEGMKMVHQGIDAFVKNCNYGIDALALYPLEQEHKPLTNNLAEIAIYGQSLHIHGSTPLFERLINLIDNEPITRAVAFSDGSPNTYAPKKECIDKYKEKKVPIDTIYIGSAGGGGYENMKDIAEQTGGTFLHFTDVSVLGKSLKYLAPKLRYMLENAELKAKIQEGKLG